MSAAAIARWTARVIAGVALLLVLAAAGLWWWADQEGSLAWVVGRVGGKELQSDSVQGSIRHGWHIGRIAWERDGLRLEAEDIRLEWEPLALLNHTLQLERVQVARARVIDRRPATGEPLKAPSDLRLPWRVNVASLQVAQLAYLGGVNVEAQGLDARYAFDGQRHRVNLHSLRVAGGTYGGDVVLQALAPLKLDAALAGTFEAPVPGRNQRVPLRFRLKAQGPAADIAASAQLQVAPGVAATGELPQATATARVTPFAPMPLPQAAADFRQFDVALFWPDAPRTSLSGRVRVEPEGAGAWTVRADVRNAQPGPWDAHRLPLAAANFEGDWRGGMALVRSLHAEAGGGTVEGSGAWRGAGWRFEGRIADVDPARLYSTLAPVALTGPLQLEGEKGAVGFDVTLQAGPARASTTRGAESTDPLAATAGALQLRDILAKGRWSGDALSLAQLRVRTADATLAGDGEFRIAERSGQGQLQFQAPGLQANAKGTLGETRGQGSAELAASDLAQAQRWLGRLPTLAKPLQALALRGQAQARLAWQGGWRDPTVQARATLGSLAWQPDTQGTAGASPWVVRDAVLQVRGRLRDAAVDLHGVAEQGQRKVDVTAAGQLAGVLGGPQAGWHGRVAQLELVAQDPAFTRDAWRLHLQRPVDWRAAAGDFELSAGEALLRAPTLRSGAAASDAVLTWTPVRRHGGQLSTAGRVSGLPLAWVELLGGPQLAGSVLSGDMVFDAQWNAQLGNTLRVDASLARVRGDVNVLAEDVVGTATRVAAGVREARVNVSTQGEQLVLTLLWDSERAGHAEGSIASRLVRTADGGWTWPAQAPLSGRVQAQLPRIGVWSLLAPPGWRLRGSLSADIAVAGTRAEPHLSGPLQADDLALRSVVDGIEMRDGRLRAQLAGQKLVVNEFLLHGSSAAGREGGSLLATGEGAWTAHGPEFRAHAQLTQLRASVRSDRELTISGAMDAGMDRNGTSVTGQLRVDRARIRIPDETPPKLDSDVVVRNATGLPATDAERKRRPAAAEGGSKATVKVSFELGDDFRVTGRGVDTRLAGSLDIEGASAGLPQMRGIIRTAGGTYLAYGQRLNIEKGELRFTGPADDPALDILAIRPNLTPKVGVQVTGRAQVPHVELYSEAGLAGAETLSYLLLGTSAADSSAQTALLQRAAAALLAGRGGTGKTLAGRLGLDDISVSGAGSNSAVVRVGKRFAENFYAAYERSLSGATGTLFIFYDVSKRVTVRAEAGERMGVDLILTFAFDGPGHPRPAPEAAR